MWPRTPVLKRPGAGAAALACLEEQLPAACNEQAGLARIAAGGSSQLAGAGVDIPAGAQGPQEGKLQVPAGEMLGRAALVWMWPGRWLTLLETAG